MSTSPRVIVVAFVLLLVTTTGIYAQSPTGYLTGWVKGEQLPLAGAQVTISSPALQGTRTATTDVNGYYIFTLLPPGEYTIRVESSGLQPVAGKCVVLLTATSRFDAQLTASTGTEAITAKAAPEPVMQSTQSTMSVPSGLANTIIGPSDMMGAAALAPGVKNPGLSPSISGGRGADNLVLVNGTPIQAGNGAAMGLFVEDAVQETTVLTSAISAEYGRFTGGVISAVTKSGGNQFSGSVRDSLTNANWAANRPGENITVDKINSFYGATLGGYLKRDRLWFFGAARDEVVKKDLLTSRTNIPFDQTATNRRYESKLTAAINSSHNVLASYLEIDTGRDKEYFSYLPIYELSTIGGETRNVGKLISGNYNAVFGPAFVIEARYADFDLALQGYGGLKTSDLTAGSWGQDMQTGAMFNAPVFCRDCGKSTRAFESAEVKGNWFFAAPRAGSHSIVAGATTYSEHYADQNHQSATDFAVLVNGVARPSGSITPYLSAGGSVYPRLLTNRSYILWMPILEERRNNDLSTDSAYVNDLWRASSHLTLNVGLRYDRKHYEDANGNVPSRYGTLNPRLSAVYDPMANGRHRIAAAYSRYVNRLADGAGELQTAGYPASIYFAYRGPSINPPGTPVDQLLDTRQAFAQAFAWLVNAAGGSSQQALMNYLQTPGAVVASWFPGYSAIIPDNLRAQSVDEYVLGYGIQFGNGLYARADYVDRQWEDFTGSFILDGGPQKADPLGIVHDLSVMRNTDIGERAYKALQFQAGWRPQRFNIGLTYTFERRTEAPEHGQEYPEFTTYEQKGPTRRFPGQRGRAWIAYDIPLPSRAGALNVSLLESYDSGAFYAASGYVDPRIYAEAELGNYGYSYSALGQTPYYFSAPDAYRLNAVTSTDFGLNYSRRLTHGLDAFVQAAMSNAFNEQTAVSVDKAVYTNVDDETIAVFDPRTETPVEGVHWVKDENFGKPYGPASYQPARTYNFSLGLRF